LLIIFIVDNQDVYFYNNQPVFVEILMNFPHYNQIKNEFVLKKWKDLLKEEKVYYLENKINYINILIQSKIEEENHLDIEIQNAKKIIDSYSQQIVEKDSNKENKESSIFI
jgi:hypothetical protein